MKGEKILIKKKFDAGRKFIDLYFCLFNQLVEILK